MRKYLLSLFILAACCSVSEGSVLVPRLAGALALGEDLRLEDRSLEAFWDTDDDGSISDGDILFGLLRFESTEPPATDADNRLYAVFSQTYDGNPNDISNDSDFTRYNGSFRPTTETGFTLADLLGNPTINGDTIDANAYIALFEMPAGFLPDLALQQPNVTYSSPLAYINAIVAGGTLTATIGEAPLSDDQFLYLTDFFEVAENEDIVADIDNIANHTAGASLGSFGAGLSILQTTYPVVFGDANLEFDDKYTDPNSAPTSSSHQVVVVGESFSKPSGDQANIFAFQNDADVYVNAAQIVPEPTSLAAWAAFSVFGIVFVARRRSGLVNS